ncbi:estradiol 17-beta-dehydrogenase 8 isoform X1, partial [Huso huso]
VCVVLYCFSGGGSGIGRAVCQRFARDGASVVVADISEDSANETLGILSHDLQGQEHAALCVDVSSRQSVEQLITLIQRQYFRPPCVCVSSAGITLDEFLLKLEEEAFDRVLRVNLKGSFLLTQAVSRALVASGSSKGVIINVGSIVGKVGNLGQANYAASKAGVEGLTKSAAKELGRFGIRCNTRVLDKFEGMVPLGRLGEPADVADVCSFLASDESLYITGASIEVTGKQPVTIKYQEQRERPHWLWEGGGRGKL